MRAIRPIQSIPVFVSMFFLSSAITAATALASPGDIHTFAGTGAAGYSGDGGRATAAELNAPFSAAVDASGGVYVSDKYNHRIRMISGGVISAFAGTGAAGFSGDGGPASGAGFYNPSGLAVDIRSGSLYIADKGNNRVRKIDATGKVATFAGTGGAGFSGDGGPSVSAKMKVPENVAVDQYGNVYIADTGNNRVRKVAANGIIRTVAGTGAKGFSGDGGQATRAKLKQPRGLALDAAGNLYIADTGNNRVRKVSPSGVITTVAGTGAAGYSGDGGRAVSARLNNPSDVCVGPSGRLFINDWLNNRVRVVDAAGIIKTFAGTGAAGYTGDGVPAYSSALSRPAGVAVDADENILIADWGNNRIRMVEGPSYPLPVTAITSPAYGGTVTGPAAVSGKASAASGVAFVEVSTDGGSTWQTAAGAASWSFPWTPYADGTYYIMSRATDSLGRLETIRACAKAAVSLDAPAPAPDPAPEPAPEPPPSPPPSTGGQAVLSWKATNAAAAGYRVYAGSQPGMYSQRLDAGNATSYTFNAASPGVYYFTVSAYEADGRESGYSNEVSKIIP